MKIICVIGMGRSGTSLLCQILSRLGVYFGEPDELIGPTPTNERGHYEHAAINVILESALKANGVDWLTDRPIMGSWYNWRDEAPIARRAIAGHLAELEDRAKRAEARISLIAAKGQPEFVLGFKNPRTALFLPLLESVFCALNLDPVYLRCLRDPHEVHESINRIQSPKTRAFTLRETLATWANYYTASQAVDALDVWYEDWFADPESQLARVADYLGIEKVPEAEALDVIDPELRHCWHKRHVRIIERIEQANGAPRYECNVCGNTPDESGILEHGKGCYVISEGGGDYEYIEGSNAFRS